MGWPFLGWANEPVFLSQQMVLGRGPSKELGWALRAKEDEDFQVPKT